MNYKPENRIPWLFTEIDNINNFPWLFKNSLTFPSTDSNPAIKIKQKLTKIKYG